MQPLLHVLLSEKTPQTASSVVFSTNNTFSIGYYPLHKGVKRLYSSFPVMYKVDNVDIFV